MANGEFDKDDPFMVPDIYADRFRVTITVFGVNMSFGLSQPHPTIDGVAEIPDVDDKVRIRTSLEHAKVIAMMLRKQLKNYESETGTIISLPDEVLKNLKLDRESW